MGCGTVILHDTQTWTQKLLCHPIIFDDNRKKYPHLHHTPKICIYLKPPSPIFYPQFLLSSNFSPICYPYLLFALKYLSGNRLQPFFLKNSIFGFRFCSFIPFSFLLRNPRDGCPHISNIRRLGPFLGFKILKFIFFLGGRGVGVGGWWFQIDKYFWSLMQMRIFFIGGQDYIPPPLQNCSYAT